MKMCDEALVVEIVGDFLAAVMKRNYIESYRLLELLENYLRGKKCTSEVSERILRLIVSAYQNVDVKGKEILERLEELIKKSTRKVKTKRKAKTKKSRSKSKTRSRSKSRSRKSRTH